MASHKEHCEDCIRELGNSFDYVHRWLDDLFSKLGPKHRDARHHKEGVEEVRKRWGDMAAKAAEIHIKKDYYSDIVPTQEQSRMWSLFGPDSKDGSTILTDIKIIK